MAELSTLDLDGNGLLDAREISAALRQYGASAEDAEYQAMQLAGVNGGLRLDDGGQADAAALQGLRDKLGQLDAMKRNLDQMERLQHQRSGSGVNNNGDGIAGPPSRLSGIPELPNTKTESKNGAISAGSARASKAKKRRKGPVMDKRMIALLARLVDERMNAEFSQRDKILVEMRDSMEVMRGELEQNILVAQQAANQLATNSPVRPAGRPRFGKGSPLTDQRLVQPGVTRSSVSQPLSRTSTLGPGGGGRRGRGGMSGRFSGRRVPRDESGRVLLSAKNMPRVAMLVPDDEETRKALRLQALAADAEYRRSMVRYKQCRSTVFMPTGYIPPSDIGAEMLPNTSLDLEFVHGYSGRLPFRTTTTTNIFALASGEIVYPASATVVIYDKIMHRQRFFFGHDDDVTCLAVHPNGSIVASGQVGRRPAVCVWDTTRAGGNPKPARGNTGSGNMSSAEVTHLGNLMFHSRGVACMAFSTDGALLVSIGTDDAHNMAVWDWENGVLLAQARAYNTDIYHVAFSPVSFVGIGTVDDLDDVTYTLITCGKRHIKFWSLHREHPDDRKKTRMEKDTRDIVKRDRRDRLRRKGSMGGRAGSKKEWVLVGNTGSFGRAAKLQDMRTFCFMPGGQIVSGTEKGHLYVWEQSRDMAQEVRYTDDGQEFLPVRWEPQGKLVGIIPNAHDSPVHCVASDPLQNTTYMTAGSDGVLVVWNIGFNDQGKLIHAVVKTIELVPDQIGGGRPCSLSYMAPFGPNDSVVVGTTHNSIIEIKADTSEMSLLITAHTGVLEAVGVHATKPFYVTAGRDKFVRVWDASARANMCRARIHAPATCVAWSPDGTMIVVGTIQGDFAVFGIGDDGGKLNGLQSIMIKQLLRNGTRIHSKKDQAPVGDPKYRTKRQNGQPADMTPMQRKMRALRGEMTDSPSKSKPFKRHEEVQDIKFSPNGKQLAVASRDNNIYIYNVVNGRDFEFNGACRGHSSYVTHLDWSEDSTTLQSNDGSYELLYWNTEDAKQITSMYSMRDAAWSTWTCTMGWPVQAIWSEESDGTDVNACTRTAAGAALGVGDDFGMVRLFRYPCVRGGGRGKGPLPPHKAYRGHMSHVMNTRFLCSDTHMLSVGGNDAAVFQWRHINQDGSTVRTILRTAREESEQMGYNGAESEGGYSTARVGARGTVHTGHGFY